MKEHYTRDRQVILEARRVETNPITVVRRFGIDAGHRLKDHEGKCRHLHGHRYEIDVEVEGPELDEVGRVVDFGKLKETVGEWLNEHWDHGMLLAHDDCKAIEYAQALGGKVYICPGPPSAENLATWLLRIILPWVLPAVLKVVRVTVHETPNCSATATRKK